MGVKVAPREVKRLARVAAGALARAVQASAVEANIARMIKPEYQDATDRVAIAYHDDLRRARGMVLAIANSETLARSIAAEVIEE